MARKRLRWTTKQFESYNEFAGMKKADGKATSVVEEMTTKSPQDMLDEAISQMNASLVDELKAEITRMHFYDFERLVVRLLIKMGYGTLQLNKHAVTQKSNDEGIDGILRLINLVSTQYTFRRNIGKKKQPYLARKCRSSWGLW